LVLSKFNESIFALSQIEILCNSLFKIFEREQQYFPENNMFVSSANNINSRMLETWLKSLIYNRNSNGPRIEPLNSTYWNLLER
jgi:hypothetical protein